MNIKDYPELTNPKNTDWLLVQEDATVPAYKKLKLINLSNSVIANNSTWIIRDGSIPSFNVVVGQKLILNTSSVDLNISAPSVVGDGSEIEFKRLQGTNKALINGLNKINGITVNSNQVRINFLPDSTVRLVYVNADIGWLSFPILGISVFRSVNISTMGLQQRFYSFDLNSYDNQLISQWTDTINNNHATQLTASNQPIYKNGIFANGNIPGLFFDGTRFLSTNLSYLVGQKYTIAVVEARTATSSLNYIMGGVGSNSNSALHVGYRSNTAFTLAQFSNDLDAATAGYNFQTPTIWVVSNNNRGKEIWRNGVRIASNTNTTNLISNNSGQIGSANGSRYTGYLGFIAVYTGDKTVQDIADIFTAINTVFGVY